MIKICCELLKAEEFLCYETNYDAVNGLLEIVASTQNTFNLEERFRSCFKDKILFDTVDIRCFAEVDYELIRGELIHYRPTSFNIRFVGQVKEIVEPKIEDKSFGEEIIEGLEDIVDKINNGPSHKGEVISKGSYYIPAHLADDTKPVVVKDLANCPDCKDGFYYPLFGERIPCPTCQSHSDLDVEVCPTCDNTNYYLGHPEGTPGPCPDCDGKYTEET